MADQESLLAKSDEIKHWDTLVNAHENTLRELKFEIIKLERDADYSVAQDTSLKNESQRRARRIEFLDTTDAQELEGKVLETRKLIAESKAELNHAIRQYDILMRFCKP